MSATLLDDSGLSGSDTTLEMGEDGGELEFGWNLSSLTFHAIFLRHDELLSE